MSVSNRLALLVIDMQQGLFANEQSRYRSANVVANINLLIHHCHHHSQPVIFIQHDGPEDDPLEPHTEGWQILPQLRRAPQDHLIRKTACDAFYNTGLEALLREQGIREFVICGCATDYCVDATIKNGVSRGYHITVAEDAHTTANRPAADAQILINHHNDVWRNFIAPANPLAVKRTETILENWKAN